MLLLIFSMLIGVEGGEDSCGSTGQGRPQQAQVRRGGSPARPRKAKPPGAEINIQD